VRRTLSVGRKRKGSLKGRISEKREKTLVQGEIESEGAIAEGKGGEKGKRGKRGERRQDMENVVNKKGI